MRWLNVTLGEPLCQLDLAKASQVTGHAPCRLGPASSDSRQGATSRRHLRDVMGFGYCPAYHIATENPPAHDATEGPPAYKRSGGIQDILLRLSAAEKPPANFQEEVALEALLRNQRNGGILLTCFASCGISAAEALASCEVSAAEALLRISAAEESSCGVSAAED